MKDKDIRVLIRRVLSEVAALDVPVEALSDHTDLYAAGLASIASVGVMLALEDAVQIEIPDHLLNRQLFQNIDSLTSAVRACLLSQSRMG